MGSGGVCKSEISVAPLRYPNIDHLWYFHYGSKIGLLVWIVRMAVTEIWSAKTPSVFSIQIFAVSLQHDDSIPRSIPKLGLGYWIIEFSQLNRQWTWINYSGWGECYTRQQIDSLFVSYTSIQETVVKVISLWGKKLLKHQASRVRLSMGALDGKVKCSYQWLPGI